ncbi:hypothetical protein SORBI_3006G020000 [Sorghum bicolor]|uniref:Clp1 P-loop domain-containing protein n=1 Tax=Sorghum bicolor TaxID=4558 RepID=A0A1Z5RBN7_SORBI|nr:hypothetical protein SORBI_3006G020000 [Sorghum bicolor]
MSLVLSSLCHGSRLVVNYLQALADRRTLLVARRRLVDVDAASSTRSPATRHHPPRRAVQFWLHVNVMMSSPRRPRALRVRWSRRTRAHVQAATAMLLRQSGSNNVFVSTTLLNMYCKLGAISDAHRVSDEMPHRNAVSWAAMVSRYATGKCTEEAFELFLLMLLQKCPLETNEYKKVGYLDIDVGQPEFTPPGFVSLHVFEEKPKDLTILYLRNPKRCFFFGDICAKRNPKLLLTYIFGLHDYFLQEFYCLGEVGNPKKSAIPLVINTSGWVKGTGLQVLTDMLKYVSPSHVIRVSTIVERKNLPGGMFWMNEGEGDSSVNVVEIPAAQNSPRHMLAKKEARIMRDLRLIAYFRQCLPREFPVFCFDDLVQGFGSIHPFRLPLSKIHVIDLHCQVSSKPYIFRKTVFI